jgi:hypothetical protein
MTKEKMIAA